MRTKLFALVAVVGMLGMAAGPGVAAAAAGDSGNTAANEPLDVSVTQETGVSISVTQNGTGVENATVDVAVVGNGTYEDAGTYTTNEKGALLLSAPEENVTIEVTASADNQTASTTADLTVTNATNSGVFGQQVSNFVQSLLDSNETGIGPQVAEFVTANNPGNAPDHAGPPEHAGPGDENESENETKSNGPPEHAGNDKDKGNDKGNGNGNGGGPSGDDSDDETETEAE